LAQALGRLALETTHLAQGIGHAILDPLVAPLQLLAHRWWKPLVLLRRQRPSLYQRQADHPRWRQLHREAQLLRELLHALPQPFPFLVQAIDDRPAPPVVLFALERSRNRLLSSSQELIHVARQLRSASS
jgi:hypothetical protein